MPSVNGRVVQNNTVRLTRFEQNADGTWRDTGKAVPAGVKVTDTTAGGSWHNAYKDYGEEGTPTLYAQTGTRAQMRKPVVRMWNTLGTNGVTGNLSEYYAESEGAVRQLNVHVENRYWWDHTAQNVTTKNSGDWYHEGGWWERLYHTYSVDGGQQGDLVMPVVTVVLMGSRPE